MRKSIIYLIILIFTTSVYVLQAQTDVSTRIGEEGYLLELKQNIYQGLTAGAQFRDFGDDITTRRTGILTLGYSRGITNNTIASIDAGYGYHNQFMYNISIDYKIIKGFYANLSFDNLNELTGGIKIRLSDLDKNCKCSYKR